MDPNRLLCANCSPSAAGGETGDFIGEIDGSCQAVITDLERDGSHAGLNAADAVQLVERHVTVPAHFRPARSSDRWAGASEVTGYAESLDVELDIDVTRVVVVELVPVPGSTSSSCGNAYLAVEASVSVSTSDGALRGGFERVSGAIYYSTLGAELFGSADAASFQGSLDIGSGHEPPFDQLVADLSLYLSPDGTRGALALSVVSGIDTFGVIDLEWPVDACGPPQWPLDATAYAPIVEQGEPSGSQPLPADGRVGGARCLP